MSSTSARGSASTDSQIYAAVKDSKQVEVFARGRSVRGYIVGMDAYHWLVLDPCEGLSTLLVHKSSPEPLRILTTSLADAFPPGDETAARVEERLKPFREHVMKTVYSQNQPSNTSR